MLFGQVLCQALQDWFPAHLHSLICCPFPVELYAWEHQTAPASTTPQPHRDFMLLTSVLSSIWNALPSSCPPKKLLCGFLPLPLLQATLHIYSFPVNQELNHFLVLCHCLANTLSSLCSFRCLGLLLGLGSLAAVTLS